MKHTFILITLIVAALFSCRNTSGNTRVNNSPGKPVPAADAVSARNPYYSRTDTTSLLQVTDEEWSRVLTPEVYEVARNKYTEHAFTGKYWNFTGKGTYYCAACGNALFRSDAKFASQCGWPSFFETIRKNSVLYLPDNSVGMRRTEVECGRCGAHLGHLFDDGPPPSYQRYCMNSTVLDFVPF